MALAKAQGDSNIATATAQQHLNLLNTQGPSGSTAYTASDAPGGYTQTTTLSPGQQALYDKSLATQTGAVGIANDQLGRVAGALAGSAAPPTLQTSVGAPQGVDAGQGIQNAIAGAGPIQTSFDKGPPVQGRVNLQGGYDAGGPIQRQVGPTDFTQATQDASNAVWQQAMSRLQPQQALDQERLNQQLANQGVGVNSAAYQNAQGILGRNQNDAINQALYSSIGAGQNEQNTLFGQALAQGGFANQAQAQQNAQNAGAAGFGNTTALNAGNFRNQAQLQNYGENQGLAQFNNEAQAQQFGQNATSAQFANQAQQQGFGQNLAANGQLFNQGLQAAQFGNEAQQQQFTNANYAQNQPINQLSALLGMGQVQTPNAIPYSPTSVAPTDVLGAQALQQQQLNSNYQSQMQRNNGLLGGLFQLGSAALMA